MKARSNIDPTMMYSSINNKTASLLLLLLCTSFGRAMGQSSYTDSITKADAHYFSLKKALRNADKAIFLKLQYESMPELPCKIGRLQKLQYLQISACEVQSVPNELGLLQDLRVLLFQRNPKLNVEQVVAIGDRLDRLKSLTLSGCGVFELPPNISKLDSVERLGLQFNQLTDLPDEISEMLELKYLSLRHNPIKKLPASMSKMVALEAIDLSQSENVDWESVGSVFLTIPNLKELIIQECELIAVPDFLKEMKQIETLDLRGNRISEKDIEALRAELGSVGVLF